MQDSSSALQSDKRPSYRQHPHDATAVTGIRVLCLFAVMCIIYLPQAASAAAPIPSRKTDALDVIEQNIKARKDENAQITKNLEDTRAELNKIKSRLNDISGKLSDTERGLIKTETKIESLTDEKETLTTRLHKDHDVIADLILAMERMRKIPPEAIIARPGDTLETAQISMLLKGTLPAVHHRAKALTKDLNRLRKIESELERDHKTLIALNKNLGEKQAEIQSLFAKQEELYSVLRNDKQSNDQAIARMTDQAKSLKELLSAIEAENKRTRAAQAQRTASRIRQASMALPPEDLPKIGKIQSPVAGKVVVKYGEKDDIGADSQGVHIRSRSGAIVMAPMGGIIQFANTFKNYGTIIIVKHKNGYHSLISGLGDVDTKVGRTINSGDPIGRLPISTSPNAHPTLYYELRYNGKPINPYKKLPNLES